MEFKEQPLVELARRTKRNLELIDGPTGGENENYEVTQLINSFLGLFIFAQQKGNLPEYITLENGNTLTSDDMRHLRNAISHFHLEPQSEHGSLVGFDVWDEYTSPSKKKGIAKGDLSWGRRTLRVADMKCIFEQVYCHIVGEDVDGQ
jgi:hypothetical protein